MSALKHFSGGKCPTTSKTVGRKLSSYRPTQRNRLSFKVFNYTSNFINKYHLLVKKKKTETLL